MLLCIAFHRQKECNQCHKLINTHHKYQLHVLLMYDDNVGYFLFAIEKYLQISPPPITCVSETLEKLAQGMIDAIQGYHSPGKPGKVGEFQSSQGKVRGSEIGCVFQALNTPKLVFRPGLCPGQSPGPCWGSLQRSPKLPSPLGRGHRIPFPQLLQPQLLNNWLSGLTLFFINMKQRLLTISVNTWYRVIFACLYWKSQGLLCGLESGDPGNKCSLQTLQTDDYNTKHRRPIKRHNFAHVHAHGNFFVYRHLRSLLTYLHAQNRHSQNLIFSSVERIVLEPQFLCTHLCIGFLTGVSIKWSSRARPTYRSLNLP